jgi:aminotransferase
MASEVGIATVPGSSFYSPDSDEGRRFVRFAYCKKFETLKRAEKRLLALRETLAR